VSEYVVIFEQADDGGWGACLPDLRGVVALGQTRDEVAAGIQQALDAYAEEMRSLGTELPAPTAYGEHCAGRLKSRGLPAAPRL
jgi:predicted RNase H-like HicB family nuclease